MGKYYKEYANLDDEIDDDVEIEFDKFQKMEQVVFGNLLGDFLQDGKYSVDRDICAELIHIEKVVVGEFGNEIQLKSPIKFETFPCFILRVKDTRIGLYLLEEINHAGNESIGSGSYCDINEFLVDEMKFSTDNVILNLNEAYKKYSAWMAKLYVNTLNLIHYMHDKYAYERLTMALHDTNVQRLMAFGVSGISVLADSLSAIKYAKVEAIKDERGLITEFKVTGDYPKYGNDDDRVDNLVKELVEDFYKNLCKTKTYRNAKHTLSLLTITSNVMYGKKTGSTPDGRKKGEPFAPGANPMHGRDCSGALASLNSVAKICYDCCQDGISNTFSVIPNILGDSKDKQITTLVDLLDGYFVQNAHHLNVNVLNREMLIDAMENPNKYPNLTIRVSGYAVNFNKLTKEQQQEVISRTFHEKI